jgi:AraC-like DNA-binding protein
MMALDYLLDGLDVRMGLLAIHVVRPDGSVAYGQTGEPAIHYGLRGAARLEIEEGDTVSLSARHATYHGSVGLFHHLRQPMVEQFSADDPIRRAFEELLDESHAPRPGSRAMSDALLRQCLIWLLRRFFERGDCGLRWLAPLEDAGLGRAMSAMHEQPQHCFSLPELAALAGMSRSVFAVRFAHAVGQSPIEFLKALRLARAAALLARTDLPVKGVAARVGYASRSSFTRAFSACHGLAPAVFRTAGRSETNVA